MSYDIGDQVRVTGTFTVSGVATDPTAVTLVVNAAGTSTTYTYGVGQTIVKDGVGVYHADLAINTAGVWAFRWAGTGAATAAEEDKFVVIASAV
jgi:hypothetical protein